MTTPTDQRKPPPTPPPARGDADSQPAPVIDLDTPLLQLVEETDNNQQRANLWTIRDACEGVQVFGAIGSGKTSGSGANIAKAFLEAGFGGLVMCAKPEEWATWEHYAKSCGRGDDLIHVTAGGPWRFNFLDYELRRGGAGGGITENAVNLLTQVIQIAEGKQESTGGESQFWERASREMLRNTIDLLNLAGEPLTLDNISRLIATAPTSPREIRDPEWREENYYIECKNDARSRSDGTRQKHDLATATRYFESIFANLGDRTRGSIVATYTSAADILLHGFAWELLCNPESTNVIPEMAYTHGAIIVLDVPIQEFHEVGRIIQGIFKYCYQKAILRRDVTVHPEPVFLWADEAQNFVSSFDFQYQAVARSARALTVYLTQNISNYYAVLGAKGQEQANALLGNFVTKIFHANGDEPTNRYASEIIGETWQFATNSGGSTGQQTPSANFGRSEGVYKQVLAAEFTRLRKGGKLNNLQVEAIIFQGGRVWAGKKTYLRTTFHQES